MYIIELKKDRETEIIEERGTNLLQNGNRLWTDNHFIDK